MKKGVKVALAGGAALLGAAGAYEAVTRLFLAQALDREEPQILKTAKARMVGTKQDPLLEGSAAAAERLKLSASERVEITARDGTRLVGHWRPCDGAKRVLIAFHGWRGAWYKDFAGIAEFWRDHGCSVLYVEQRGQGESGGDGIGFGLTERYDCLDWANWVNEHGGMELPIYLAGISMGATTVLMAAGFGAELPENVRGIMADCGFTSAEAIWKHVTESDYHIPYGLVKARVSRRSTPRLGCAPDAYSTVDAMRATDLPVLFVHGLDDRFVPPGMTEENYAVCTSPKKRMLLVPGAKHGLSYLVDREAYERETLAFWNDCEG